MTERQLTFIDVDENSLVLWLKEDRVQLRVVDSRPELEADELRAFAAILFATYVGPPLAARLEAARAELDGVRARLASGEAGERATDVADIERSLRAIEDVAAVIAGVRKLAPASAPERPARSSSPPASPSAPPPAPPSARSSARPSARSSSPVASRSSSSLRSSSLASPSSALASAPGRRPRKPGRGRRAGEGEAPDWGWVRHDRDDASAVSA